MIRSTSVSNGLIMQAFQREEGVGGKWIGKGIQLLIFHDEVKIAKRRPKDLKGALLERSITCGENGNTLLPSLWANQTAEAFPVKVDEYGSQLRRFSVPSTTFFTHYVGSLARFLASRASILAARLELLYTNPGHSWTLAEQSEEASGTHVECRLELTRASDPT